MSCLNRLSQWQQEVSTAFAHLSQPQIRGLVLWSVGMTLTGTAGIVQISALLAIILQQQEQSVFQRLREWYLDAASKSGKKRRELDVRTCFAPLLRGIVRLWDPEQQQMVLVLDATSLRERWTVLSISVVIGQGAIPVAWKVVRGHEKGSWRPHWEGLLDELKGSIPHHWQVLVMADRGLYAQWLFERICACGWHPFLRLNVGIKARALDEETFDWVSRWTPTPGTKWKGQVECFVEKKSRITATLLMQWEEGYEHPWIVLTDLPVEEAEVSWYGMRTWVETGFKDFKGGLWGWHHSKMERASCVERLWLAMALGQLWTVSVGSQAEGHSQQHEPSAALPPTHLARRRRRRPAGEPAPRRLSWVGRGRLCILAALLEGSLLPCGALVPQPWPQHIVPPRKLPSASARTKREHKRRHKRRNKQRTRARSRTAA